MRRGIPWRAVTAAMILRDSRVLVEVSGSCQKWRVVTKS